jgi:hypothetical protein
MERVPGIPNVNVCCGIMSNRTAGHCFFHESSTLLADCLDMLDNVVFPKNVAEAGASCSNEMVQEPILVQL